MYVTLSLSVQIFYLSNHHNTYRERHKKVSCDTRLDSKPIRNQSNQSQESKSADHMNFMWQYSLRHIKTMLSITAPCNQIRACEDTF